MANAIVIELEESKSPALNQQGLKCKDICRSHDKQCWRGQGRKPMEEMLPRGLEQRLEGGKGAR